MNLQSVMMMLKGLATVLEPMGEEALNNLWLTIDAEIAKMASPDMKDIAMILSPALKQAALMELKKLK